MSPIEADCRWSLVEGWLTWMPSGTALLDCDSMKAFADVYAYACAVGLSDPKPRRDRPPSLAISTHTYEAARVLKNTLKGAASKAE